MNYQNLSKYGHPTLRIGMALVFLWFAISQLMDATSWLGYLPPFLSNTTNPVMFIYLNASLELVFGLLLLIGIFVRISALILSLHLIGIIVSLGYNEIAVRDFGLMMGTLAIAFNGPDQYCLMKNKDKTAEFFST